MTERPSDPQRADKEQRALKYVVDRQLDALEKAHVALTSGTGYDPAKYSSTYSEAAALIRRLHDLCARSAGTRIEVDVPMIEAACAELLETSGIDLGGDEMRLVLQAALGKATHSARTSTYQRGDRVMVANESGHIEEGKVHGTLIEVELDYDGSVREYKPGQLSMIDVPDRRATNG